LILAERNFPKVHEARAKLRHKRAQAREARLAPFSDFKVESFVGVAPTVHGTSVYSPDTDVALSDSMGLLWQVGIEGAIPLWTFGKLPELWAAADAQVRVGENEIRKEKNELRLNVRKSYYGLQLARDALALIQEARGKLDEYISRLAARVAEGEGDDIALVKARMYGAELEGRESTIREQEAGALAALRFLTGIKGGFDIPEEPLRRAEHSLAPLARYLAAARLHRPEINMARAGLLARRAQVRLEEARFYPDVGLGLSAKLSRAPEVPDQRNPFVRDRANYFYYGAGLVLRWKLDLLPKAARLAQARAELEEMRATEQYALGGVGVEVQKAFARAQEAERRLEAATRAARYAKQWLVKVQQGIDIGTIDEEDLVDPAKEYALKQFGRMSATFDYNMAIAALKMATGWEQDPVD
jgi:outer membrane protein TolC